MAIQLFLQLHNTVYDQALGMGYISAMGSVRRAYCHLQLVLFD